ncbi:MAG: hypothetical protein J1G04_01435 [Clostridiales bacterium]|nr:hypothetical protein [Clostridiales bacterium]
MKEKDFHYFNDPPTDLFIIGNGFDIWQGLNTSYKSFARFYNENKLSIAKELKLEPLYLTQDGNQVEITHFDLYYGLITGCGSFLEESDIFWSTFEDSLSDLDHEQINYYYGKEDEDLEDMQVGINQAYSLIRERFVLWTKTFNIPQGRTPYNFQNSFFINFNYTDTLQRKFGVKDFRIYYPHGNVANPKSIIFGHDSYDSPPPPILKELGGRNKGLYQLATFLYKTDKHVRLNIVDMMLSLFECGFDWDRIKNVYILGHSMSNVDIKYFKRFAKETAFTATWHVSCFREEDKPRIKSLLRKLHIRKFIIYDTIDDAIEKFKLKKNQSKK